MNLAYNGLSDNGAAALGRCARLNKTLRELDVSNNRISANGARVFATGLKKNTCLEVLRVRLCLWSPYVIGQTIVFSCCGLFFLLLFFPRLISAAADWMSTILRHMVWP